MIDLTTEQIAAAKTNDLTAITAVIEATEERVLQLARRYATTGGRVDTDLMDDLAQVGRIAVWEAIARFEGDTPAQLFAFMDRTVQGALSDERKRDQRPGVSRSAANDFERCISEAKGDPFEAERLAHGTDFLGSRKMSRDMARACRLSWEGMDHLDAPYYHSGATPGMTGETTTHLDILCRTLGMPGELIEPGDVERARKLTIKSAVHRVLDKMGRTTRNVLVICADFGIGDSAYYGDETGAADREMADDFGVTPKAIAVARNKGRARFEELYLRGELEAVA